LAKFFIFLQAVKRQSWTSTSGLTIFLPNPVTVTSPGSDDDDDDDSKNDDPLTKQSFKFTVLFHCLL
jgi:hypothetical protein